MKNISIIIPNWNGAQLLKKNIPKVISAKHNKENGIVEIIVVDDASTDNSFDVLTSFSKEIKILKFKKNRGFSAAVNAGIKTSKGRYVCLLNTDVVPRSDFLMYVRPHFKDKNVFGVSLHEKGNGGAPDVTFKDGYLSFTRGPETKEVQKTLWVSGGSGVFDREKWDDLHGLDGRLYAPFYREDTDLGYRAWKRGFELLWEPRALVTHEHETTINTNNFHKKYMDIIKERNELLFHWKNITSSTLFQKHMDALAQRVLHHPGYLKVVLAALLKLPLVKKRRSEERKEATVSDEAVFSKFS